MYQVMKSKLNYNKKINEDLKNFNFKKLFNWKSVVVYLLSILMGFSKLSSGATPFSLAFLGAIADNGFPLIAPLLIITLVTGVSLGWTCVAKFLLSSLIFIFLKSFIKGNTKTGNAAKVLFATALSEVIILSASGTMIYDGIMAAFMSTTAAIFYLIFSEGLGVILNINEKRIDSHETLMACGVMVTVAMTALGDMTIFGFSVLTIISVLIVMMLGWLRGMAVGITTGVAISIVLGLVGIADASMVAIYTICGLLAGLLARYGKIGAIIGFILGNAIWVFCINASTSVIIPIGEIVIASVILFFMPNKVSLFVDDLFESRFALDGNDPIAFLTESTIFKLKEVSNVAKDMADNIEKNQGDLDNPVSDFIKTLTNNCCSKCKNYENCWNKNYHLMYETVFNSLETLSAKSTINKEEIKTDVCSDKEKLLEGLKFSYELYKVNNDWKSRINENRKLAANQLRGVSEAVTSVQYELGNETVSQNLLGAGYKLEVGFAKTMKKGSNVSGDSTIFTRLKDGKIIVGVSDGMGSGEQAKKISRKTLDLLEKYLNTGLDKKVAIELINSYMMLGENKDNFSTLDVLIFDEQNAQSEFIKFSACKTYIKSGAKVEYIKSNSLPIGTSGLEYLNGMKKNLSRGDLVVLISDGIIDANSKNDAWVKELLASVSSDKPQRLADIILQEAIDFNYGVANDDMTVIVVKVC